MAFTANEDDEHEPDLPVRPGRNRQRRGDGERTTALRHPVRREILRKLHACQCERTPAALAEELGIELKRTIYHVRVLAETGAWTRQKASITAVQSNARSVTV